MPASYFTNVNQMILEFIERVKRPRIINLILKEKKKLELILLDFNTH